MNLVLKGRLVIILYNLNLEYFLINMSQSSVMIYHINHLGQNSSPSLDWLNDDNLVYKENRMYD